MKIPIRERMGLNLDTTLLKVLRLFSPAQYTEHIDNQTFTVRIVLIYGIQGHRVLANGYFI